ncbi:YceK/YidQ family lipoprotein [Raoultella terrigena]
MMKSGLLKLVLFGGMVGLSGCSSVMSHTGGKEGTYPGTRASAQMLGNSDANWGTKSLVAIDMPLTAVMDTLLLPWDMFRTDSSIKSRVEKSERETLATNEVIPPATMTTP